MQSERGTCAEDRPRVPEGERYTARDVVIWALSAGRPLSPRALEVVIGAKSARPEPFSVWTEAAVSELLWTGIVTWCQERDIECPPRVAETMWTFLSFLYEARRFAHPSHSIQRLRRPLWSIADLTRDGRERVASRPHPSEQQRAARPSARLAPVVPLRRAARG